MDPISQGAAGAILPQTLKFRVKLGIVGLFGFVAGMAADLDILIRSKTDPLMFLEYHRQFTHSLVFIPIGSLVAGYLLFVVLGKRLNITFKQCWLMCATGYGTHGLLDACTTYGTVLFWPFTNDRIAMSIISIIDPLFTIPIILCVFLSIMMNSINFARFGLLWMVFYLLLGAFNQRTAVDMGNRLAIERGHSNIKVEAKPSLANIWVWKTIYELDGRFYVDAVHTGLKQRVFEGQSILRLNVKRDFPWLDPDSQQARDIERFDWFSMGYIAIDPKREYHIADIRYSTIPNEIAALWSIKLDPKAKNNQHVEYKTHRNVGVSNITKLWDMILSGWN